MVARAGRHFNRVSKRKPVLAMDVLKPKSKTSRYEKTPRYEETIDDPSLTIIVDEVVLAALPLF